MILVREERSEDIEAVRLVNETAFGQPSEANIVDKLRENCQDLLSLVAVQDGAVVGHILFSPARIEEEGKNSYWAWVSPPWPCCPHGSARELALISSRRAWKFSKTEAVPLSSCLGIRNIILASALNGPHFMAFAASGRESLTRPS